MNSRSRKFPQIFPLKGNIRWISQLLGLLLLAFLLHRIAFLLTYGEGIQNGGIGSILSTIVTGVRFDLATIAIFDGILILFLLLPIPALFEKKITWALVAGYTLLINIPLFVLNFLDIAYFQFSAKRISHEIFTTGKDLFNISSKEILQFWYLILMGIVAAVAFGWIILRMCRRARAYHVAHPRMAVVPGVARFLLAGGLIFLAARGGWQPIPIRVSFAYGSGDLVLGSAGINTGYSIISGIGFGDQPPKTRFSDAEAAKIIQNLVKNDFDGPFSHPDYPLFRKSHFDGPEAKYNVIIIMLESFNGSSVGILNGDPAHSVTPVFDSLSRHGLLFTQYFSTASRSVESIPAILNSSPDIFTQPTIGSPYEVNRVRGIPQILKERGYHTSIFHAGRNGTLGLDAYTAFSGIDHYYGLNQYPTPSENHDGYWGTFDGPFMQWMAEMQMKQQGNFFSVFFSLTNHTPFPLPETGSEDIKAMDITPMEKTMYYTDRALGRYLATIKQAPWYDSTYIFITADHTFFEEWVPGHTVMDNFSVPMLILGPEITPGIDSLPGCHTHILPTVIELLRLEEYHASVGKSLLQRQPDRFVMNGLMELVTYVEGDTAVTENFVQPQPSHVFDGEKWHQIPFQSMPVSSRAYYGDRLSAGFQVLYNVRTNNKGIPPKIP